MRLGAWTFFLLLMSAVVCVSAVPPTDLPETSYNEVDTPVNQAPPVVPGIKLVRPFVVPTILPRQIWEASREIDTQTNERNLPFPRLHRDSHSLQMFLCTLLI
jgi:hypothetical protein